MAMATTRSLCSSLASTSSSPFLTGETREGLSGQQNQSRVSMMAAAATSPSGNVRIDLLVALSRQTASQSQKAFQEVAGEVGNYARSRNKARNLEEALMSVPDLETIPYTVIRRERNYEIRQVDSYLIAETEMISRSGFDFIGSGQGFNTLAEYLFGKNTKREAMEMTTPVVTQKGRGEVMEMTTPVVSQKGSGSDGWRMSFVLPSKYSEENVPAPQNDAVKIRRVPSKTLAVVAFSGWVSDGIVEQREAKLRLALSYDPKLKVKEGALVEVAQYNPPFTPPFTRRNEIALEVELF